jgi:hypothetical protein
VANRGDPPPHKATAPNLGGRGRSEEAGIDAIDASPAYHRPIVAASGRAARLADQLIEIESRAARRDQEARRGAGFLSRRVRDLTTFFADTYGDAMTDDDAGRDDMFILAQHVARLNGDPARAIAGRLARSATRASSWWKNSPLCMSGCNYCPRGCHFKILRGFNNLEF